MDSGLYAISICLIGGLLLLVFTSSYLSTGRKYPNGPPSFPVVGNPLLFKQLAESIGPELMKVKGKWGDLCMLWYGSMPILIISSPRAAKEILNERGNIYSSRPEPNAFRKHLWPWRLILEPAGETFRWLRKLYHSLIGSQQSLVFRKYQDHESTVLLRNLVDKPEMFLHSIERYTMSIVFSTVYGVRLPSMDHPILVKFIKLWDATMHYFEPGTLLIDFIPILQYLPWPLQPWNRRISPLVAQETSLHQAFLKTLKDRVNNGTAPDCFGKLLIEVQEKEGFSDFKAVHILAMLVGAGSDTTAQVLQGFFKIMALHPKVVEKAHEELDRVIGPDRMPTWEDEFSLPYIRGLIKEVHRWAPIGNLGTPHFATADDVYEGNFIPKGTVVFPNLTALSKDPERYPNPEVFDPHRFREDTQTAIAAATQQDYLKRDHFHYGFGRRMCPGIHVAEASLFIIISRVLWGFDILAKPGCALDMLDRTKILIYKHNPYEVDIVSRGPTYEKIMQEAPEKLKTGALSFDDVMINIT